MREKANDLRLGAIYINANTGTPCRLVNIVPCEGAWLETFDGEGYGDTVKFEDVHYADSDEVQDFWDDLAVLSSHTDAPSHKSRQVDVNGDVYVREDEDYLCRD